MHDATSDPYLTITATDSAPDDGALTITVNPEQVGHTTIPLIESPMLLGKVRHRPDKNKAKRRRKLAKASRRRNRQ